MCAPIDPTAKTRSDAGFSLIEAIVSFAILALALTASFEAGRFALRATSLSGERTEALLEARSLLDRALVQPLRQGSVTGTTELGHPYRLSIEAMPVEDTRLKAYAIEADIGAGHGRPLVSLSTLKIVAAQP